ncbi:MAG: AAA family ATPase [Bacteroidota bacterium]
MAYWIWSVPPDAFPAFVRTGTFALRRQGRPRLGDVRPGDRIFAYLPGRRVLAGEFEAVGEAFEDTTALVPGRHLPHRLRVRPVHVLPEEARVPYDGFAPHLHALDGYAELPPEARFRRLIRQVLHPLPPLDGKVLEFVVQARLGADPETLMRHVEAVREARAAPDSATPEAAPIVAEAPVGYVAPSGFDRAAALARLGDALAARGFVYAPWEVATYAAAVRTKPFVLLAGVTGVGKSRLPVLVAEATGAAATVLPVRPDWTDPAETMGYTDLAGRFRPGAVLRAAHAAAEDDRHHTLVLDEMNLGRPEHYLAEVLIRIEQRARAPGGYETPPLLDAPDADAAWQAVRLPPTLALVGTVNVDESAHAFSRKVLDRAFVLELSAPDLRAAPEAPGPEAAPDPWPASAWAPRAVRLGELDGLSASEQRAVDDAVEAVAEASTLLAPAGLNAGYRTRDEAALFVLHATETPGAFRTEADEPVDPVDLALLTKLVPRIDGARAPVRAAVGALLGWAWGAPGAPASGLVDDWVDAGRPASVEGARFPRTTARLARIVEGALDDGVASFWA